MLARDPLCVLCKAQGIYKPTDEIDHIKPLHQGGEDGEDNLQGLCSDCHAAKTAAEGGGEFGFVSNHPEWLEPSAIPLTIVCGPPCSGKTTYVAEHADADDVAIDLDAIMLELDPAYQPWTGERDKALLDRGIRLRNRRLGELSRMERGPHAWFVVSAPTQAERDWWHGKLGGEVVLLHPGFDECRRRAIARGTPKAVEGIADWERRSREPWRRPKRKVAIGADGWPAEA